MSIPNGSKFSFNDTVGPRNFSTGFLPAIEYAYGTEQWGWGGGVCQASTTVYLAAIQSGMTILSREPHSMAVSYTEYGKDATVSDTRGREIDFSFRNESGVRCTWRRMSSVRAERTLSARSASMGPPSTAPPMSL